jgi:acetyl esterase/lipase
MEPNMSARKRIDPESRVPLDQLLEALPGGFNAIPDIVDRRAAVTALLASLEVPENPRVVKEDRMVPGPEGAPEVPVRIYRQVEAEGGLPGIFFIPGAGWSSATSRARTTSPP